MTTRAEKEANATFWACRRGERHHVRIGQRRQDGTQVVFHGTAQQLHGPDGICVCCHGRKPVEVAPSTTSASAMPGDVSARVAALVHPQVGLNPRHPNKTPVHHGRVREAMHRFRPGQPLTWGATA